MTGIRDGVLDCGSSAYRPDVFRHALHLPAGNVRVAAAALLLFTAYFPAAVWFKLAYKEADGALQPLPVYGIQAAGTCISRIFLPRQMTKLAIYDDRVRVGYATRMYEDPGRLELNTEEKHWRIVLFDCRVTQPLSHLFQGLGVR